MQWKPKRLSWVSGLLMVPSALAVFVLLRLLAPGVSMPLSALIAAAIAVALVRGGVLLARTRRDDPLHP